MFRLHPYPTATRPNLILRSRRLTTLEPQELSIGEDSSVFAAYLGEFFSALDTYHNIRPCPDYVHNMMLSHIPPKVWNFCCQYTTVYDQGTPTQLHGKELLLSGKDHSPQLFIDLPVEISL
jgi:hypothetical protein